MPTDAYYTLFAKKEVTYKTDPLPTAALNAVLCRGFKPSSVKVDQIERKLDRPVRGASPSFPSNVRRQISYEVELAGSGAAGTAPAWMELLEGCGMAAATLTASTKAEQRMAPIGALSSLTHYHFVGDQRRRGNGGRGDITSISFVAGELPYLALDFTELLPAATPFDTVAPGAPDYTRWRTPVEVNTANTSFTLDGFAAVLRSAVFQVNADVKLRNLVGANYVNRGNHAMTGKILIELPTTVQKNYFTNLIAGSQVAMAITHGIVAGNGVDMEAGFVQIIDVSDEEEDDIAMLSLDVQLNISAGQDDFLLRAR